VRDGSPLLHDFHLSISDGEHGSQIINVTKNEIQVAEPARSLKKGNAGAAKTCCRRCVTPEIDYRRCLGIFRQVPMGHQHRCNPSAAYLVFFTEFTFTSGTDDGDTRMTFG
jgi:hypothetical protein